MFKEAFHDNALGQTQTYKWFKCFKSRWMRVNDNERSGRPSVRAILKNVAEVREAFLED